MEAPALLRAVRMVLSLSAHHEHGKGPLQHKYDLLSWDIPTRKSVVQMCTFRQEGNQYEGN